MTASPEHVPSLAHIARGRLHTAYAVLCQRSEGRTRNGDTFFDLHLADVEARIRAKVWSDAPALEVCRKLENGQAVKALFAVDEYQGTPQANVKKLRPIADDDDGYDPQALYGPAWQHVRDLTCGTLVFDIETVPAHARETLPGSVGAALERAAQRSFDGDEQMVMGLSPLFGKVVSIAVGDGECPPNDQAVTVLAVPPDGSNGDDLPPWIRPLSERDLLEAFWALAGLADVVVSFNGRGFDVPFLIGRSCVLGVKARVDLLANRFGLRPHLDLNRVMARGERIAGPANLDTMCWALGIPSPKESMDGAEVAPAYARGEIQRICEYNAHDVRATTALYHVLRDRVLRFRDDW